MQYLYQFLLRLSSRTGQLLQTDDDTDDSLYTKKLYFFASAGVFITVSGLTLLTTLLRLPVLTTYGLSILLFYLISVSVFIRVKKYAEWFYAVNQLYIFLATFITILRLGGLLYSGGLLFVGLSAAIFSMALHNRQLALWSGIIYLVTLVAEGLLQPWLTPAPEITPNINLLFFTINAAWISVFILLVIYYAISLRADSEKDKAKHLEELHQLKNRLFVNISHEFRTPLTAISGMAELLQAHPDTKTEERTKIIIQNTNKILRLVEHILNLSRLETGTMSVQNIRSNIVPFVGFVVDSYSSLAEMKSITLVFAPDEQEILMDFDPDKTEELIGNLLSNAIKYTPAGGKVSITIHRKTELLEQVFISVSDTGIGIASHEIARIFDPYYRGEEIWQHYEEGSGIGLALVKAYLNLINGTIDVQSQPGKGSTFTIILPVTQQAPCIEQLPAFHQHYPADAPPDFDILETEDNPKEDAPMILIVEDNKDIIAYLRLVLGKKYRILGANNGEEGIQQAITHVPDVVLTDVMMPQKDGFELCRILKSDFRTNHIPVVLLSARADLNSRITGLEYGADAYLTKPFNRKELLACLRNLLIQREKLRSRYAENKNTQSHPNNTPHPKAELPDGNLNDRFLEQINSIIEQNYEKESFGVEELCHRLNMSRSQLHRKLMALTGNSASHYLRATRMEKARQLLLHSNLSVAEIAYDTGFSDPNYFTRIFTQQFGHAPSAYRKDHTGGDLT